MYPCAIGQSLFGEAPGHFLFGSFLKLSFGSEPKQQRGYVLPRSPQRPQSSSLPGNPFLARSRYTWDSCRNLSLFLDDPDVPELKGVAMSL